MPVKRATTKKVTKSPAESETTSQTKTQKLLIKTNVSNRTLFIGVIVVLVVLGAVLLRNQIIVATVNGQPITRLALIQQLEKESGKKTLDSIITKTLILQEANKQNKNVTDSEINEEITKIDENLKKQGQDLAMALKIQGMTMDSLKDQMKVQLTLKKLLAEKTKVSEKEVKEYIEKNKENLPKMDEKELKNNVKQQLEQEKLNTSATEFLQALRSKAKISNLLFK